MRSVSKGGDFAAHAGENPAIVVGNAQPDLMKWVEERRRTEAAHQERLIVASKHEALGILEGLQRLGFV